MKKIFPSSLDITKNIPFVLDEENLKKIWGFLEKNYGKVSATIKFSDDIIIYLKNVKDIVKQDNPKKSHIIMIKLSTSACTIKLQYCYFMYQARIDVRLVDISEQIKIKKDKLEIIIDGLKPWYSPLCKLNFTFIVPISLAFTVLILKLIYLPTIEAVKDENANFNIAFLVIFCAFIVGWIIDKIKNCLFPQVTFAIGQGVDRYTVNEKIRWIFISLLISAILGLIYKVKGLV